jgi:serine/threonine-protein kinase
VLEGTEGAFSPFFSPDGQWVAFFANGQLLKISVEGGSPVKLCDAPPSRSLKGYWGDDGNILAVLRSGMNLDRVPSAGGNPEPITQQQSQSTTWFQVFPGSKAALLTVGSQDEIHILSFADGRTKRVLTGGRFARYSPSGHLLYQNHAVLFAVPFDLEHLEVHGSAVPVVQGIAGKFDFSRNGTLVYRSGGPEAGLVAVRRLDAAGETQDLLPKLGRYSRPFSPGSDPHDANSAAPAPPPLPSAPAISAELQLSSITILSQPSGASVYVDGYPAGRTPTVVKLKPGTYNHAALGGI